jgi:hypothetical protein
LQLALRFELFRFARGIGRGLHVFPPGKSLAMGGFNPHESMRPMQGARVNVYPWITPCFSFAFPYWFRFANWSEAIKNGCAGFPGESLDLTGRSGASRVGASAKNNFEWGGWGGSFSPPSLGRPCPAGRHQSWSRWSMIRKLPSGEYRLYSRKKNPRSGRRRNLGTFRTRKAAEAHERAVQYFKRH